jgi:hypothetical protein
MTPKKPEGGRPPLEERATCPPSYEINAPAAPAEEPKSPEIAVIGGLQLFRPDAHRALHRGAAGVAPAPPVARPTPSARPHSDAPGRATARPSRTLSP